MKKLKELCEKFNMNPDELETMELGVAKNKECGEYDVYYEDFLDENIHKNSYNTFSNLESIFVSADILFYNDEFLSEEHSKIDESIKKLNIDLNDVEYIFGEIISDVEDINIIYLVGYQFVFKGDKQVMKYDFYEV